MATTPGTIRWGILSAGKICHDFVQSFNDFAPNTQNNEIVAVAARDGERAQKFAARHKIGRSYGSYEELAKDPEIDVIYVGNMHTHRGDVVKMCLDHGKHLLVEKPVTMSYKDTKELLDYAKSKKLFLMEAVWSRFFPGSEFIRKTVAVGKIGEPRYMSAVLAKAVDVSSEWADHANGIQFFMGPYPLQAALSLFDGEPTEVVTSTVKNKHGVPDTITYTLTFQNGAIAQLMSTFRYESESKLYLEGTKGTIEVPQNMWTPTEVIVNGEKHEFTFPKYNQSDYNYDRSIGLFYEMPPVADCIRQGLLESPLMSHQDTLTMAKIHDQVTPLAKE